MKRLVVLLLAGLAWMQVAYAELVSVGQVTRFHSAGSQFGVYLSGTTGCADGWYYSARADFASADDYKAVMALALTAYAQQKRIAIFHAGTGCAAKRFTTIDAQE